jgi:hypothetical protein
MTWPALIAQAPSRILMAFEFAFVNLLDAKPHVACRGETLCFYTDDDRNPEFKRERCGREERRHPSPP